MIDPTTPTPWQAVEYNNGHRNQQRVRSVVRGQHYQTRIDTRRDPQCPCLGCTARRTAVVSR